MVSQMRWCGALLNLQVQNLTEEVAALEDENRRLSEVIQTDQPHNEELLLHVKELQHVRPPPPPPPHPPPPPPSPPLPLLRQLPGLALQSTGLCRKP